MIFMDKVAIRVKCLELCNRHDMSAEQIIAKAEILVKWATEPEPSKPAEIQKFPAPYKKGQN
jgi:hypothetical protein